jgi:hypothetical protein
MFSEFNHNLDTQISKIKISDDSTIKFKSEREFLMYYHTTIRNVGLFTSIAVAAISAGRSFGKGHKRIKQFYSFVLFLLGLMFVLMAIRIGDLLIRDLNIAKEELDDKSLNDWLFIPRVIFYVNIGLIFVSVGSIIQLYFQS